MLQFVCCFPVIFQIQVSVLLTSFDVRTSTIEVILVVAW